MMYMGPVINILAIVSTQRFWVMLWWLASTFFAVILRLTIGLITPHLY